jgi:hypothetical protein
LSRLQAPVSGQGPPGADGTVRPCASDASPDDADDELADPEKALQPCAQIARGEILLALLGERSRLYGDHLEAALANYALDTTAGEGVGVPAINPRSRKQAVH